MPKKHCIKNNRYTKSTNENNSQRKKNVLFKNFAKWPHRLGSSGEGVGGCMGNSGLSPSEDNAYTFDTNESTIQYDLQYIKSATNLAVSAMNTLILYSKP